MFQPLVDPNGTFKEEFKSLLSIAGGIRSAATQIANECKWVPRELQRGYLPFCIFLRIYNNPIKPLLTSADNLRNRAHVFDVFSNDEYVHHPYHWHKTTMLRIGVQMKYLLTEACELCEILQAMEKIGEEHEDSVEQITFTADYLLNELIPNLRCISKVIYELIIISRDDGYYSKTHASNIVLAHRKGTPSRAHIIKQLVANKCVPSRAALYKVINIRENGLVFVEEEWNTKPGRKKNSGKVIDIKDEDETQSFYGQFMIAVIPKVRLHIDMYNPPQSVDICDSFATSEKLYFSPRQFPTPADLNEAGKGAIFDSLKTYIEYASEKGGSPVVCRSHKPGSKKFVCKYSKDCSYKFMLRWDEFGYYIHLHNNKLSQKHNHCRGSVCPFTKFGCCYCKETFLKFSDAKEHESKCTMYKHSRKNCKTCNQHICEFEHMLYCDSREVARHRLKRNTKNL